MVTGKATEYHSPLSAIKNSDKSRNSSCHSPSLYLQRRAGLDGVELRGIKIRGFHDRGGVLISESEVLGDGLSLWVHVAYLRDRRNGLREALVDGDGKERGGDKNGKEGGCKAGQEYRVVGMGLTMVCGVN